MSCEMKCSLLIRAKGKVGCSSEGNESPWLISTVIEALAKPVDQRPCTERDEEQAKNRMVTDEKLPRWRMAFLLGKHREAVKW